MQLELELLAPAKNIDIGISAINCGADAVYIAGPAFGAREAAGNSFSDIEKLVLHAHKFGAKVYLALNTILYDSELKEVEQYIKTAYTIGCDAIIIQDLGILKMELPPIPLIASTQTNIRTPEQARFLESLGFKRLILARELSLEQIKRIHEAVSCELESFVHGALCVSYSGQCYLSQYLTGRSANRGSCVQACRSRYDLLDSNGKILVKNKALLSLKDLSLASHIGELIEAGVTSFKIEGRLKNASYVKNITRYYREIIDITIKNTPYRHSSLGSIRGGFTPNPRVTFNRGYTDYFISGKRGEWNSMETPKSIGESVGRVSKILSNNIEGCSFTLNGTRLSNGDGLSFLSDKGEIVGMRVDSVKGEIITTKEVPLLRQGTEIFRNYHHAFEKELENNMPQRVIAAKISLFSKNGKTVVRALSESGARASVEFKEEGDIASNRELALNNITRQFSKSSEPYLFSLDKIEAEPLYFYPLSRLNSIRRELAERLLAAEATNRTSLHGEGLPRSATPPVQTTNLNCSNSLSEEVYGELGISAAPAYEVEPSPEQELMRTKYCIKYELGWCPKEKNSRRVSEPLFLENQGRRLKLIFDCTKCEMVLKG